VEKLGIKTGRFTRFLYLCSHNIPNHFISYIFSSILNIARIAASFKKDYSQYYIATKSRKTITKGILMNISKCPIRRFEWLAAFGRVTCAVSVATVLSVGSVAKAESLPILRNITTGQTIFHDDFENHAVVPLPSSNELPSSGLEGTWMAGYDFGGRLNYSQGVVDSWTSIGQIEAKEGNQFLQISTNQPYQGVAMTGHGNPANSGAGDTIEANIAFYMATGSVEAFFYLYAGDDLLAAFSLNGDNTGKEHFSLSAYDNTTAVPGQGGFQQQNLYFTPNSWNTMKVVHVNGTDDWTVSFNDGESITVGGYQAASEFLVDSIYFNQTSPTTVYFDAVPIPEE